MLAGTLGLLLLGAGVGLHLEEVGELSMEEANRLASELGKALEPRAGGHAVVDDPLWPECTRADRCLDEVRQRTHANELVYLRLFGGPTKIRLFAERLDLTGAVSSIESTVPRDANAWSEPLGRLAIELYPTVIPSHPEEERLWAAQPKAEPQPGSPLVYIVPAGVSLALGVTGAIFGVSSRNARHRIETTMLSNEEYDSELSRMRGHGLASNVLLSGAIVGLAASVVLFLVTEDVI